MKILFEFKLDRNHAFALSPFFLHFPACGFFVLLLLLCFKERTKRQWKNSTSVL